MITENRKQFYIDLIKTSFSLREVCLRAGIIDTTGNYKTLKRLIEKENIDITHFKRQNVGQRVKHEIEFYLKKGSVIGSSSLREKILKEGLKERKCENCGLTEWMGNPIKLELHHINGDNTDNRIENLQILCPNCHSFTDNYGGKNQKLNVKEKKIKERREEINIEYLQKLLFEYDDINVISEILNRKPRTINKYIQKFNLNKRPKQKRYNIDEMITLMKQYKNYTKVGDIIGISDNAVKKRFISLGYPNNIRDLILKL